MSKIGGTVSSDSAPRSASDASDALSASDASDAFSDNCNAHPVQCAWAYASCRRAGSGVEREQCVKDKVMRYERENPYKTDAQSCLAVRNDLTVCAPHRMFPGGLRSGTDGVLIERESLPKEVKCYDVVGDVGEGRTSSLQLCGPSRKAVHLSTQQLAWDALAAAKIFR